MKFSLVYIFLFFTISITNSVISLPTGGHWFREGVLSRFRRRPIRQSPDTRDLARFFGGSNDGYLNLYGETDFVGESYDPIELRNSLSSNRHRLAGFELYLLAMAEDPDMAINQENQYEPSNSADSSHSHVEIVSRDAALESEGDHNDADYLCPICLEYILKGDRENVDPNGNEMGNEEGRTISYARLNCGHKYHPDCIRNWMQYRRSCPVCRVPI